MAKKKIDWANLPDDAGRVEGSSVANVTDKDAIRGMDATDRAIMEDLGFNVETGEIDLSKMPDYTVTGIETIMNFIGGAKEGEFLSSTVFNFLEEKAPDTAPVPMWNRHFGWSLSEKPEHKDKLVVVLYARDFGMEELVMELVPHADDDSGLTLLSTYAPEGVEFNERLHYLSEFLFEFAGGRFQNVYLESGYKIIDGLEPNEDLLKMFEAKPEDISESQLEELAQVVAGFNLATYFPNRSLMMMFNMAATNAGSAEKIKVIEVQVEDMLKGANRLMNILGDENNED